MWTTIFERLVDYDCEELKHKWVNLSEALDVKKDGHYVKELRIEEHKIF